MAKRNKKNDSVLILSAVTLLILSGIFVFGFSSFNSLPQVPALKIIGKAELTIDFSNGKKRAFEGDIVENETLIDILTQAAKAGSFSYKLDNKNKLSAIENFSASDKKYWQGYLNGKKTEKPFYEIVIRPNDKILIKYARE